MSRQILGVEEKGQVAREYNAMLRSRLGLTDQDVSRSDDRPAIEEGYRQIADDRTKGGQLDVESRQDLSFTIAPTLLPNFAGLYAQLTF